MRRQELVVKAHDKQLAALELRKQGLTYPEIAERVGYRSQQSAWKAVQSALNKTIQEPAQEVRTLEIERLDKLLAALWPLAQWSTETDDNGDEVKVAPSGGAIDRVLRIMERRAKLLGLDAPAKQEVDHKGVSIKAYVEVSPDDWDEHEGD